VIATALRQVERPWRVIFGIGIFAAAIAVLAMMVWQGVTAHGAPDPTQPNTSPTVAFLDIGILVFRRRPRIILVLAAITASMTGANSAHRKPCGSGRRRRIWRNLDYVVHRGADCGFAERQYAAARLTAATGLLAVVVLLVIHELVFPQDLLGGGWIRAHNRRRKALLSNGHEIGKQSLLWGLSLLGFTSLYREGFEVVLFLQRYNLRFGGGVVLKGALLGIALSGIVARSHLRSATAVAVSQNADHNRRSTRCCFCW